MRITSIAVRYGELRSTASFSNVRHEIEIAAEVDSDEPPAEVHGRLQQIAKAAVREAFGEANVWDGIPLPFWITPPGIGLRIKTDDGTTKAKKKAKRS